MLNEEGEEELRLQTEEQSIEEEYETTGEPTEVETATEENNLTNIQLNLNIEGGSEIPKISRIFFNKDGVTIEPNRSLPSESSFISKVFFLLMIMLVYLIISY